MAERFVIGGTCGLSLRNCKLFALAEFAANPDTAEKLWKLSRSLWVSNSPPKVLLVDQGIASVDLII